VRLEGSERAPLPGARRVGGVEATDRVAVTLVVRHRPDAPPFPDVAAMGRVRPEERSYLTREEFAVRHGAHPNDLGQVAKFARAHGLVVGRVSAGARTVQLEGPVLEVARLFGVTVERWSSGPVNYRGRTGPIQLPAELEGVVVGVFGLDDRPQARPHFRRHKTPAPTDVAYAPGTVAAAYDFPVGANGAGETIGLLEFGGGYSSSDLATFFGEVGVTAPTVTVVSVDGATNSPTGDPDGPDGEVELDVEVAGSTTPGSHLVVYFAPNTEQGFVDALNEAVHDTTNRPSIISLSWGAPESGWTTPARSALNAACEDASAMGVTVLVAAGDNGASDGVPGGALTVDFPASSPFVLGCGGTRLLLSGETIVSEVVWNELAIGEGATGGGVSEVFPLPSFQSGARVPPAPNGFVGRGVPDVAGDADPASGYSVVIDGSNSVVGGTSAVAPLWAALFARINQSLGVPVGYVNALLYSPSFATAFHDITSGNNDGYSAGPGWDACTGLGSPDGARLLQLLRTSP